MGGGGQTTIKLAPPGCPKTCTVAGFLEVFCSDPLPYTVLAGRAAELADCIERCLEIKRPVQLAAESCGQVKAGIASGFQHCDKWCELSAVKMECRLSQYIYFQYILSPGTIVASVAMAYRVLTMQWSSSRTSNV